MKSKASPSSTGKRTRPETIVHDASKGRPDVPDDWMLLPPGDATLTRRVKAAGKHVLVQERRGRRVFSRGVWAPTKTIERIRSDLESERSTPAYAKRQQANERRREKMQAEYVEDFCGAVLSYLDFHSRHADLARRVADAVTKHATPVGSGTVARTRQIPIEARAEAAVIAWMRHQTTDYDSMSDVIDKDERRAIRRQLARRSKELLNHYRNGEAVPADCPLQRAVGPTPPARDAS